MLESTHVFINRYWNNNKMKQSSCTDWSSISAQVNFCFQIKWITIIGTCGKPQIISQLPRTRKTDTSTKESVGFERNVLRQKKTTKDIFFKTKWMCCHDQQNLFCHVRDVCKTFLSLRTTHSSRFEKKHSPWIFASTFRSSQLCTVRCNFQCTPVAR